MYLDLHWQTSILVDFGWFCKWLDLADYIGSNALATHKSAIVGDYKHNKLLYYTGWIVVLVTAYIGVTSLQGIAKLLG